MTANDLERRYDYNYWANRKLFAVIAQLTPEQFTQNVAGSYASIRNTLVHMMSAEWGWIERCGGPARGAQLRADDYPTPASTHAVHHRGQIALLLRVLGVTPGNFDLLFYDIERRAVGA
jgi:uncharacterized damage-inducible protein DinB